ncbi:hypothetical protein KSB_60410 [Ktedonobacter robiniae]|uniref:Uncharacterized protein n=1 Tax=Ktedonobacter robiniae TaxID=2778365 RepID=A0ABQ3UXJ1_9CHLR|nr:hypothetical protein KSB_60410 [Ktedonobacter robiniae]
MYGFRHNAPFGSAQRDQMDVPMLYPFGLFGMARASTLVLDVICKKQKILLSSPGLLSTQGMEMM